MTFTINGEKFKVNQEIISEYHKTQDKYIYLIDEMVDQGLDLGVEFIDNHPTIAKQVEKVEDYINN